MPAKQEEWLATDFYHWTELADCGTLGGMTAENSLTISRQILATGFVMLALALSVACGTLNIEVEDGEPGLAELPPMAESSPLAATESANKATGETFPAVAWYGSVHTVPGSTVGDDYFKPWHLAIWPKFGPAVGLIGIDPAINAEIDRLRDQDIKATFWGEVTCGVADYGACRLLVTRLSADDGGPQYEADKVENWQGSVGRLPGQPGSQNEMLYFVLDGPVIALYGIASDDPAIQAELERLAEETIQLEGGGDLRIWGKLNNKIQPVTGTRIDVTRLEMIAP